MTNNKRKTFKKVPTAKTRNQPHLAARRQKVAGLREEIHRLEEQTKTPPVLREAYDPELLYVECGRCGAPVIWEEGRARVLLKSVGVDALELDEYCMLQTDGCPGCRPGQTYHTRIVRIGPGKTLNFPPFGNA